MTMICILHFADLHLGVENYSRIDLAKQAKLLLEYGEKLIQETTVEEE